jgi:four helix bundle protein
MINFEKLNVYQEAVRLALDIYQATKNFPKDELFGIVGQLRCAAVSISLNIAGGSSRSKKEFAHFLDMARGSGYELVPLLKISLGLKYMTESEYEKFYRTINGLAKKISALKNSVNYEP